jgi:hypothetical protein
MREPAKYETYLRPILQRLKAIDGRAPVSIMTCSVRPDDPQLQSWLGEGLSLECHTIDHPCPLLQGGDFAKAKSTYDRCVYLLNEVPGNKPVAFRMPCCDSLNTVSPRFYREIISAPTLAEYLQISSSVFNVFAAGDPAIPRELVTDPDGREKFRKYLPKNLKRGEVVHNHFVNWIENYPYPFVINKLCWEFPCVVPSDWEANHLHQPKNPDTVRDMKAALDITVLKQGVYCLVFHPHGWIRNDQVVELIDHAVERHGGKVRFLTFREANDRLERNLLGGADLGVRDYDNGIRLLDIDSDGYLDVIDGLHQKTRVWSPETGAWSEADFPFQVTRFVAHWAFEAGATFGVLKPGVTSLFLEPLFNDLETHYGFWHFEGGKWTRDDSFSAGLPQKLTRHNPEPHEPEVVRLRDVDGDGACELIAGSERASEIFRWEPSTMRWKQLPFQLPPGAALLGSNDQGTSGVRWVDVNADGSDDVVLSTSDRYGIWLFKDLKTGWSIEALSGKRGERKPEQELPPIVRADGTDNGFFVHSGALYWQNEDTAHLPDLVERRSFADLLKGAAAATDRGEER